ncbi:MAG: GTPase Era [Bacteroidales bacterium]|jgi:GTP-binding protein Era|nr:GTPase Era [Bacteroidales bacterium]
MEHRSGFVNILGNPNVGKSTLMNVLVGEKLSVATSRAQTTRHRIMGILTGEGYQIVYSDTPGILNPKYKLQSAMMRSVESALDDADLILYVTDTVETATKNADHLNRILASPVPKIIVINKIDLTNQPDLEKLVGRWSAMAPGVPVLPVSAINRFNTGLLMKEIICRLPEGPPYFPPDQLTDRYDRFFVTEIIRGKIFETYQKEIPYSVEVEIESYREETEINRIAAVIYVARDSQKGIIIGHKGSMLKRVGTAARKEMEEFLGKKVFLELYVRVAREWRDNPNMLKKFGYI